MWILRTIATVAILLLVPSASRAEDRRTCIYTDDRFLHVECRIDEPYVGLRFTPYPDIPFLPGDSVSVDAGGRFQIGGTWATWKLYVNPQDDVSNNLYHGLIYLPVPGKVLDEWAAKGFPMPDRNFSYRGVDASGKLLKAIPYKELDLNLPRQSFDIAHELTNKGIQKFVADYQSTLQTLRVEFADLLETFLPCRWRSFAQLEELCYTSQRGSLPLRGKNDDAAEDRAHQRAQRSRHPGSLPPLYLVDSEIALGAPW